VLFMALLVSPHVEPHDLTLAIVPGWILAAHAVRISDRPLIAWLWVGWLCGFVAAVAATLPSAPAVVWMAATAVWLLWGQSRGEADWAGRPSLTTAADL
jgi:hypothetical protein